jgi:hypothetical protein
MSTQRATLLVYNTVDRLLRGDLFHTVSVETVRAGLAQFPADWPVVGVGTTNWMRRNGELITDGVVGQPHFWWADPEGEAVGQIIDVAQQHPSEDRVELATPQFGVDDDAANFPFLVAAVGNPETAIRLQSQNVANLHQWLIEQLTERNLGVVGVQVEGTFGTVKTTDAYNIPLGGLNLSGGYTGDDHFRYGSYESGRWVINGVYAANPSLQPFISVLGMPLHLHGYERDRMEGGHIVSAEGRDIQATLYPMDDFNLIIHNVANASNAIKPR